MGQLGHRRMRVRLRSVGTSAFSANTPDKVAGRATSITPTLGNGSQVQTGTPLPPPARLRPSLEDELACPIPTAAQLESPGPPLLAAGYGEVLE